MKRFEGKFAVVTGGTQGLGAAIARLFAASGFAGLVTCGRSADKGASVAASIAKDHSTRVEFVKADLGVVDDCRAVITAADEAFGRIDVLSNAAAVT